MANTTGMLIGDLDFAVRSASSSNSPRGLFKGVITDNNQYYDDGEGRTNLEQNSTDGPKGNYRNPSVDLSENEGRQGWKREWKVQSTRAANKADRRRLIDALAQKSYVVAKEAANQDDLINKLKMASRDLRKQDVNQGNSIHERLYQDIYSKNSALIERARLVTEYEERKWGLRPSSEKKIYCKR